MIGMFDSGSGGLTVLRSVRAVVPSADIVYFGDIKNAPYGSRSREELSKLTTDAMQLLLERGARSMVSACNSVSASLAVSLFDSLSLEPSHLIEMVGPTVAALREHQGAVLLVATPATIESGIYQSAFRMIGRSVDILPIPELAPALEFGATDEEIRAIIEDTFGSYAGEKPAVVVLACTHYPLAIQHFHEVLGEGIAIFDPADAVASRVERRFWPREAGSGNLHFIISKDSALFRARVAEMFPNTQYEVEVLS